MQSSTIMEIRFFKFRNYLLILFSLVLVLACEKGKNNSTETNLTYELTKVAETDSTVSLRLHLTKPIKNNSSDGREFSLAITELLVCILPVIDSSHIFITFLLAGNTQSAIDSILTGSLHGNSPRGLILSPLLVNNTFLLEYSFTIRRGIPYLFYNSFINEICTQQENSPVSYTTIKLNETIAGKNISSEYNQLTNLMNLSFPSSNSKEITNTCGTITSSYEFYRDRPVKLLYYPL